MRMQIDTRWMVKPASPPPPRPNVLQASYTVLHKVHVAFLLRSASIYWRLLILLLKGLYMDGGRADVVVKNDGRMAGERCRTQWNADWAVCEWQKDGGKTVHGRNQVSGFLKRLSTFC